MDVYHPVFIEQAFRLLRAKCIYCHHFRIPRLIVHKYKCKFHLIRHGLIEEAVAIENIGFGVKVLSNGVHAERDELSSHSDEEEADYVGAVMNERNAFVRKCLLRSGDKAKKRLWSGKNEAIASSRRNLLKEFFDDIGKQKKCTRCKG